jgi:hypothetical protein
MKTVFLTFLGSLLLTGLAHAAPAYVMWHEWSSWVPGKPSRAQQFLVQEDGRGQFAEFVDDKVVRLASFSYANTQRMPAVMGEFLKLDASYETPPTPRRVEEGRGERTWLFVSAQGQRKHVLADKALQPRVMQDFRQTLLAPPGGQGGSLVSVQLMPDSFRPDAADMAQMPTLDAAALQDFPEVLPALSTPFWLVELPPARWEALLLQLKLSRHATYVKTAAGSIAKWVFYPPATP